MNNSRLHLYGVRETSDKIKNNRHKKVAKRNSEEKKTVLFAPYVGARSYIHPCVEVNPFVPRNIS